MQQDVGIGTIIENKQQNIKYKCNFIISTCTVFDKHMITYEQYKYMR